MYQRGSTTKYHKGVNGTIGFALGNEFTNLVSIAKGEQLAALPINKLDVGLSEVPYMGHLVSAITFRKTGTKS